MLATALLVMEPTSSPRSRPALRRAAIAVAALAVTVVAPSIRGQEVEECPGAVVQQIFVDNHSIFNTAALAPGSRFGWVYSSANR
ncbi:MAG: hypothetical protein HKN73_16095, partial [Gemmatimonadetes bacterium]|nr:hypothetical protein [Gemmatimonadota bacterium]